MIRKKYENLEYNDYLTDKFDESTNRVRRRYDELYAVTGAPNKEEETQVDYEKYIYRPLRRPNLEQLKRVVTYSQRFADYNDKTSITKIGNTRFDDFELFEQ